MSLWAMEGWMTPPLLAVAHPLVKNRTLMRWLEFQK